MNVLCSLFGHKFRIISKEKKNKRHPSADMVVTYQCSRCNKIERIEEAFD